MLAVGLAEVKALDVGRVPADVLDKEAVVVIEVPVVEAETHLPVYLFERGPALFDKGDIIKGQRFYPCLEGGQLFRIRTFGHPVVKKRRVLRDERRAEGRKVFVRDGSALTVNEPV